VKALHGLSGVRALVTGGAGFVGSWIVEGLIDAGASRVVVVDDFSRGRMENVAFLAAHTSLEIVHGDICDAALIDRLTDGIDLVFHQAALRITECADDPVRAMNVLVGGTQNVLQAAVRNGVVKVTVRVHNLTSSDSRETIIRGDALNFSLVSAHIILGIEEGEFLSLLDPPTGFEDLVGQCSNIGTWPVLIGDQAETMLSSPIILYDHPQIAPESAGNLFDSTEIDEILSLRILTLTDDEKREMRQSDDRVREILERTENMPEEQFMKLHGVLRGLTPLKEEAR